MAAEEADELINRLQKDLERAKDDAKDFENKMMKAAMLGKELLDKNLELENAIEIARQEKHELGLKLQAKVDLERSLSAELDSLRDSLKADEEKRGEMKDDWEERLLKRDEEWKIRLGELELEVEQGGVREIKLKEEILNLEEQIKQSSLRNQSITGDSISGELERIEEENMNLVNQIKDLQEDLINTREELDSFKNNARILELKLDQQNLNVESLQCEMSGYCATIESQKMEIVELQAQLDAQLGENIDQDGKGNSLFSEVEDRRQRVESQLSALTRKYDIIKEGYDVKVAELQKVKMHNSQLLSIAGTRNDTEHVGRLEDLLRTEKDKVRVLMDKLETIERLSTFPGSVPPPSQSTQEGGAEDSNMDTDTSTVAICHDLRSKEYQYLAHLLQEAQNKNKEFQEEMRKQVRLNMEESDKQQELCRKLHSSEQQINKLKAESYTLRIQVEELKAGTFTNKYTIKEPKKRIVEQINFNDLKEKEEKENVLVSSQEFQPKEILLKQDGTRRVVSKKEDDLKRKKEVEVREEKEEKVETGEPEKKRRGIVLCDKVEEISTNGEQTQGVLAQEGKETNKEKAGVEGRGRGRKHFTSKEVHSAEPAAECKQQ
ncbi:protein Spindly-B isoform X2 [Eurytemora carolleeae]|uniref:protein Spindly-B isoform X2 n=1 Tax=Eurytemora carolleeae TaxID=1294199 RepID=UPI000C790714|nr:protein Spindly-B isoform X2 [Eurytemora carolleeae]|eukprot:XP_023334468.1 protein Spindly-B-like isoform X2 [Eurytemora affinis]